MLVRDHLLWSFFCSWKIWLNALWGYSPFSSRSDEKKAIKAATDSDCLENEQKNMKEVWTGGDDYTGEGNVAGGRGRIMSRGALALAGAAQLMQMGLILICFSHGHVSRVPNGGTGAKTYQKIMTFPQNFFKSRTCVLSIFLTLFKGNELLLVVK